MKNIFKKYWKIIVALSVIIAISISLYFIFKALGVTNIENLRILIASCGAWGWFVFILLQVLITSLLCFVPATSMLFIGVGVLLFGSTRQCFLICLVGVVCSSVAMDLIGRFGGSRLIIKLIGEKEYKSALGIIQEKGMVYVPCMYLMPLFPDDAICMCVGMSKMKFWLHLIYILLCRGIGVATIVFGISILPEDVVNFTSTNLWDYILVITVCLFWVIIMLYVARIIDKKLTKRLEERKK